MTLAHRLLVVTLAGAVGSIGVPVDSASAAKPRKRKSKKKTPEEIAAEEEAKKQAEKEQRAIELFTSGKEKFDLGNYEGAIEDFEAAFALLDEPNLLYNIAQAHAEMGDFEGAVSAIDRYRERAPEPEHEMIDEQRAEWQAEVDKRKPPPKPENDGEPDDGSEGSGSKDDDAPKVFGVGPAVLTVVAIAGLGTGLGLGLVANRARDDAYDLCVDGDAFTCQQGYERRAEYSSNLALGANVAFGVGGAAALATVIWVSINASRRAKWKKRNAALTPVVGPRQTGLSLSGRF